MTALVIVGAQVSLFSPERPVWNSEGMLKTLGWLIERARNAGVWIVYVQNSGKTGEPDQRGSAGWQIHPAIAPREGDLVIQKSSPDAFSLTPLQKELARKEVTRLFIAGMQTEASLDATVRRASSIGYDVTLVGDGHSTYDSDKGLAAQTIESYNTTLGALVKVIGSAEIDFRA